MLLVALLSLCLVATTCVSAANETANDDAVASQYSLTTSTSLPFPTATLTNTQAVDFVRQQWNLNRSKIDGQGDIAFVNDPFPNSHPPGASNDPQTSSPVLQVAYPQGSFSHNTGGVQLHPFWESSTPFQSMLLSYEVAFDTGFDWVKGGKLPGIRGGIDPGCSGGKEATGQDCFTARMMWRTNGAGEAYLYIPTANTDICKDTDIICNSDFGTSVGRGDFTFNSGEWNHITLLVQLNDPPNVANGHLKVYHNGVLAVEKQNLQYRSASNVTANGLWISTFFGGNDKSWATPVEAHTHFRNFRLWASSPASTAQGSTTKTKSVALHSVSRLSWGVEFALLMLAALLLAR